MTRDMVGQVYEMDPAHRPDREMVAKEIDKLDGGRPVTHYDVLAWMQVFRVSPVAYHLPPLRVKTASAPGTWQPRGGPFSA